MSLLQNHHIDADTLAELTKKFEEEAGDL